MLAYLVCFIPIKALLMSSGLAKNTFTQFSSSNFVISLVIIELVAIYFFYNIFKNGSSHKKFIGLFNKYVSYEPNEIRRIKTLNIIIIILLSVLHIVYFSSIGAFDEIASGNMSPVLLKELGKNNPISYVILKGFATTLMVIWSYYISFICITKKKHYLSLIFFQIFALFIAFITGSRGAFISIGIFPPFIIYNSFIKRLNPVNFLLGIPILVFIAGILGRLRSFTSFTFLNVIGQIKESFADLTSTILSILDRRFDSYFPNLLFAFDNIDKFDTRFGFDYIFMFLRYIPRFLWEDKPLTLISKANVTLEIQYAGGTGFAPIFEAWVNLGIIGILLNALLAAYFLNLFQKAYINSIINSQLNSFIICQKFGIGILYKLLISPGITHQSAELLFQIINIFISLKLIKYISSKIPNIKLII